MLTNFIENNRQKCEKYFPLELNEEVSFHSPEYCEGNFFDDLQTSTNCFSIKNCGMIKKPGYTIRKLDVRFRKNVKVDDKGDAGVGSDNAGAESDFAGVESDNAGAKSDFEGVGSDNAGVESDIADVKCDVESDNAEVKSDLAEDKSEFKVKSDSGDESESVIVYHYWFHNWADHKCPKDVNALLNLSLDVLKDTTYDFDSVEDENDELCKCNDSPKVTSKFVFPPLEAQTSPCEVKVIVSTPLDFSVEQRLPPTIVHCSAGIGRTGCLIAILNGIKQLTNEQKVDVLGIVCNMRLNRGGMVQNSEQYELIHKVLCLFEQACLPDL